MCVGLGVRGGGGGGGGGILQISWYMSLTVWLPRN